MENKSRAIEEFPELYELEENVFYNIAIYRVSKKTKNIIHDIETYTEPETYWLLSVRADNTGYWAMFNTQNYTFVQALNKFKKDRDGK